MTPGVRRESDTCLKRHVDPPVQCTSKPVRGAGGGGGGGSVGWGGGELKVEEENYRAFKGEPK